MPVGKIMEELKCRCGCVIGYSKYKISGEWFCPSCTSKLAMMPSVLNERDLLLAVVESAKLFLVPPSESPYSLSQIELKLQDALAALQRYKECQS